MSAVAEKKPEQAGQILVPDAPYSKRTEVSAPGTQPANLTQALCIAAADPRMDLAKVQGLWAMHKEMMDREASQAFADALARAQSNIGPISKNRRNDHTKSKYATLDAIVEEVTPVVSAEGLAISFDTFDPVRDKDLPPVDKGWVRVIAIVSHRGGHSRKYHLDGPVDNAGKDGTVNKTGIQAMGSTVSYLRRYLVCMIFNVATADDNDGNNEQGSGTKMDEKVLLDHLSAIEAAADEQGLMKAFGKAWNAATDVQDKDAQRRLTQHRDAQRKNLKGVR